MRAALASDASFAFIYTPPGVPVTVHPGAIRAQRVAASWFDPRYGIATSIHTGERVGFQTFEPPTSGRGCDWVLVLDDPSRGFPLPGQPG